MEFLVTAYDGKDANAPARRAAARPAHVERAGALAENGQLLIGGAILDNSGNMIGSSLLVEFENREALDQWLENDPYVTAAVWQQISVVPFRTTLRGLS